MAKQSPAKTQKTHHVGLSLQAIPGNRYEGLRSLPMWWAFCMYKKFKWQIKNMNKNQKGWMNTEKRTYTLQGIFKDIFSLAVWFFSEFIPQIVGGIRDFVMEKFGSCEHQWERIGGTHGIDVNRCLKCKKVFHCDYLGRIYREVHLKE